MVAHLINIHHFVHDLTLKIDSKHRRLNSRYISRRIGSLVSKQFQDSDFVYIQCDVIVCDMRVPNDPECQTTCRQNDKLRVSFGDFISTE